MASAQRARSESPVLRSQFERHDGLDGRWAEVSGAAGFWLLQWSGGPALEYPTPVAARDAARDWAECGLDPRRARTLVVPAAPAGSWS